MTSTKSGSSSSPRSITAKYSFVRENLAVVERDYDVRRPNHTWSRRRLREVILDYGPASQSETPARELGIRESGNPKLMVG
ncbi:hypothetical protein KCU59_g143, partial [Aureobasidium melanogenum]